jgi:hypothetical protein
MINAALPVSYFFAYRCLMLSLMRHTPLQTAEFTAHD